MKNFKLIRLNKSLTKLLGFIALTLPCYSYATIELTEDLRLSGFGSTSATKSDNKTPIFLNRKVTDEACYDCDTIFGLQLDFDFLNSFTSSVQVVKRTQDEFSSPEIEWAYIGYQSENFDFKAGKLRLPLFLHSEYFFVAQAYTEARPNQEVYDGVFGVTSFTGANTTWNKVLSDSLQLSITPYYGGNYEQEAERGLLNYTFDISQIYGAAIDLSGDNYRVHLNALHVEFDLSLQVANVPTPVVPDLDANAYSLGGEYDLSQTTFTAEAYKTDDALNWYGSVKHRFGALTPYITYGKSSGKASGYNHSITTGIRYDLLNNVSLNLEYQQVNMDKNMYLMRYPDGSYIRDPNGNYIPDPDSPIGQFELSPLWANPSLDGTKVDAQITTFMVSFIF
ncbi:MAG: porin [Colwellia sp.]